MDVAVAVHGDPVVGLGQVLGGQPSVHGMPGQAVEAQRGGSSVSLGSSPFMAPALDLPIIWMLPNGEGRSWPAK